MFNSLYCSEGYRERCLEIMFEERGKCEVAVGCFFFFQHTLSRPSQGREGVGDKGPDNTD